MTKKLSLAKCCGSCEHFSKGRANSFGKCWKTGNYYTAEEVHYLTVCDEHEFGNNKIKYAKRLIQED